MSPPRGPRFSDAPAIVIFCALAAYILAGLFGALGNDLRHVEVETARAERDGETITGLAIPTEALHQDGEGDYVWVITAQRLERKTVNIIHAEGGLILAEEGRGERSLRPGDKLVTAGSDLYEGKILT